MLKSRLAVAILAASIAFSPGVSQALVAFPAPASPTTTVGAFGLAGCVASIMLAAIDKGNRKLGQLTTEEAATCGLAYWIRLR
ncbi:MAG: hypothetical protein KF835_04895 [Xanthobacteraceae bacterium]|nr:hypothetical protein [Xanthobacteraceae bacterium]